MKQILYQIMIYNEDNSGSYHYASAEESVAVANAVLDEARKLIVRLTDKTSNSKLGEVENE